MKKLMIRVGVTIGLLILAAFAGIPIVSRILYIAAYLLIGGDVLKRAVTNIGHGQVFDENFLMSIATIGAFLIGENLEAVAVMLFYQVGEGFNDYAVGQSRKSIQSLLEINPDYANVLRDGKEETVDPYEVMLDDIILVKPGERIPLDGIVLEGRGSLDTSAITGESLPRNIEEGDEVLSGCINLQGVLKIKVTRLFEESTVSKILELVENASNRKAKAEAFITRFARYYTPIVVCVAVLLVILPIGANMAFGWFPNVTPQDWLYRGLEFLVVSCPCALVISVPLSFFGGLGAASKQGILIKGSNYLEALANVHTAVFDKTGTITTGRFSVTDIVPEDGISKNELLEAAAYTEYFSNHPISLSIKEAYGKEIDTKRLGAAEEIAGFGMKAVVDGIEYYAGNDKLVKKLGAAVHDLQTTGTVVYILKDVECLGHLIIGDTIKPDSREAMKALKNCGVRRLVMLTGDKTEVGQAVAKEVGMDEAYTELLPQDKVEQVETLLAAKEEAGSLIFTGDGINDAPVLATADIGVAMGGIGSDAAIEAADVIIMTDELSKLATAIAISRKTMRIVKQNIVFALVVKIGVLLLTMVGLTTMWAAVFADVGVSLLAVLNSMRAMKLDK